VEIDFRAKASAEGEGQHFTERIESFAFYVITFPKIKKNKNAHLWSEFKRTVVDFAVIKTKKSSPIVFAPIGIFFELLVKNINKKSEILVFRTFPIFRVFARTKFSWIIMEGPKTKKIIRKITHFDLAK
jgi:hypothetical protein